MSTIRRPSRIARALLLLGLLLLPGLNLGQAPRSIYWGARISGSTYGLGDAPWDARTLQRFSQNTGKAPAILSWGQPWWLCSSSCRYQRFNDQLAEYEFARRRGHIPLIDWASWDYSVRPQHQQMQFALRTIISGQHDDFIREWAAEARDWGHPFFLRFNWEMNGDWFPWSEQRNGNRPGEFAQAWRRVHGIFAGVGATNVSWVWCPNVEHLGGQAIEQLYPGDSYVDWLCMDGYNWGTNPARPNRWQSFAELFGPTYSKLVELSPGKPIMIGETASTEHGGAKAAWISDALTRQLPLHFPRIEALVWFNWNVDGMDWVVESSPAAREAFAAGIRAPFFASNEFAHLGGGAIQPLSSLHRLCVFAHCRYY